MSPRQKPAQRVRRSDRTANPHRDPEPGHAGRDHAAEPAHEPADTRGLSSRPGLTEIALVLVALAALTPTLVPGFPEIHLDHDPRAAPAGGFVDGMGPAAVACWQVFTVGAGGLTLGVAARVRGGPAIRGLAWFPIALVAVGIAACCLHLRDSSADQWTLGGWVAGLMLALAGWHLGRCRDSRAWLLAMAAAMALPWCLDGLVYVFDEHPRMLRMMAGDETTLLARGIEPGSTAAELYLRRAADTAATGAIGLSNVFGSLVAAALVIGLVVPICGMLGPRQQPPGPAPGPWWHCYAGALAVVAAGVPVLWLTESRGAIAVLLLVTLAAALVGLVSRRTSVRKPRLGALIAGLAGLVLMVPLLAVIARGVLVGLPTSPGSDPALSLLFRYWYLEAGIRMIRSPDAWAGGLGVAGLGEAFPRLKNGYCPEDVSSLHNAAMDWLVVLGPAGVAVLVLALLAMLRGSFAIAHAARAPADDGCPDHPASGLTVRSAGPALFVAAGLFLVSLVTRWAVLIDPLQMLTLVAGLAGLVIVATLLRHELARGDHRLALAGWAAGLVILAHSMIEMTLFQPGSCGLGWLLIGLAAAGVSARPTSDRDASTPPPVGRARRKALPVAPLVAAILPAALLALMLLPTWRQDLAKALAAETLRNGDAAAAREILAQPAAMLPPNRHVLRYLVGLGTDAGRIDEVLAAVDTAQELGYADVFCDRLRAGVLTRAGRPEAAVAALQRVVDRRPHGLEDHMQLADLLWALGRQDLAATTYALALDISERYYLDPARQLSDADRRRAESRALPGRAATPRGGHP